MNNKLHFFNGAKFDGSHGGFQEDMNTHWQLDLGDVSAGWKTLAPNSLGRNHVGGTTWGGKIFALGGQFFEDEGCTNQKLAEMYDPRTNRWSRIANLPAGTGHISPSTLSTKEGIVIVGGVTDKNNGCRPPGFARKQLLFYNPRTDTWLDVKNKNNGATQVSGFIDGKLYMQSGYQVKSMTLAFEISRRARDVNEMAADTAPAFSKKAVPIATLVTTTGGICAAVLVAAAAAAVATVVFRRHAAEMPIDHAIPEESVVLPTSRAALYSPEHLLEL